MTRGGGGRRRRVQNEKHENEMHEMRRAAAEMGATHTSRREGGSEPGSAPVWCPRYLRREK